MPRLKYKNAEKNETNLVLNCCFLVYCISCLFSAFVLHVINGSRDYASVNIQGGRTLQPKQIKRPPSDQYRSNI